MKKLMSLLFMLLAIQLIYAQQIFPVKYTPTSKNAWTQYEGLLGSDLGIVNGIYPDTASANLAPNGTARIKRIPGCQIMLYDGTVLIRNITATKWVNLSSVGAGTGSVTSLSVGNLSPLFTSAVTNGSTTPLVTYTFSPVSAYNIFGRASGSGSPSWLTALDSNFIPSLHTENYYDGKYIQVMPTWAEILASGENGEGSYLGNGADIVVEDNKTFVMHTDGAQGNTNMSLTSTGISISKYAPDPTYHSAVHFAGTISVMGHYSPGQYAGVSAGISGVENTTNFNSTQFNSLILSYNTIKGVAEFKSELGSYYFPRTMPTNGQTLRIVQNLGLNTLEWADWPTIGGGGGGGDMIAANNLSDLTNFPIARFNLGLGNVDNTSDVNKPVSTAQLAAIALKLGISDTTNMLSKYLRKSDTTAMLSVYLRSNIAAATYATITNLNLKLTATDTTSMLSKYLRITDASSTYATITNLALKMAISDSATMLSKYLRITDAAATYGTITNLNLKLAKTDTTSMLSPYLRSVTATATYAAIQRLIDSCAAIRADFPAGGGGGGNISSLNGSSSAVQTFAIGSTGTAPNWVTAAGVHTLHIPFAANTGVTAGVITKVQYDVFNAKEPAIASGTTGQYYRGDKTWQTLDKTAVGLSNVDNTSDANKPISSAALAAIALKLNISDSAAMLSKYLRKSDTTTMLAGYLRTSVATATYATISSVSLKLNISDSASMLSKYLRISDASGTYATITGLNLKEPSITAGTTAQYWRGDKTWQTLNKTAVGLANVDNTTDIAKPISTATQTALNAKVNIIDGTMSGNNTLGTVIAGVWSGTVISPTKGGTGLASFPIGSLLYASAANVWSVIPPGTTKQSLRPNGSGGYSWKDTVAVPAQLNLTGANHVYISGTYPNLTVTGVPTNLKAAPPLKIGLVGPDTTISLINKLYTGTVTQSGTSAPVVTTVINDIGSIVWTRSSAGVYIGTLTGAFTASKTICSATNGTATAVGLKRTSDNTIQLTVSGDNIIDNMSISVSVYP